MRKEHSEKWYEKWNARLLRPFGNTRIYNYLPSIIFLVVYMALKDYYHGWQAFLLSFLNISIFWKIELTWKFIPKVILWAIGLSAQIIAMVYMIKSFKIIAQVKYYEEVSRRQACDYLGSSRAVNFAGPPGVGKTFSAAANLAIILAQQRWEELKNDYYLGLSLVRHWKKTCDTDKLKAFKKLEESFLFFAKHETTKIPCLVSSLPIKDLAGRFSYQMTDEILSQCKRLPECCVLMNDESGLNSGTDTSRNAEREKKEFFRFCRHFTDVWILNTDQREMGNGIYVRASTDYNYNLRRQQTIMRPYFGERVLARLNNRYIKNLVAGKYTKERARYLGEKYYYYKKWLETVGFRKVPYSVSCGNGGESYGHGEFIFPRRGYGDYDSRTWREMYKAKDKEIEISAWDSLVVDEMQAKKNSEAAV